jgi:hypothetical protein
MHRARNVISVLFPLIPLLLSSTLFSHADAVTARSMDGRIERSRAVLERGYRMPAPGGWGVNSAGVTVVLAEVERALVDQRPLVVYRIRASGFRLADPLQVWTLRGNGAVELVAKGVVMDPTGVVVSPADGAPLDLLATGHTKGEALELAVLNADQSLRAFAKVIPFPD